MPNSSLMAQAMPEMTEAEYHKLAALIYKVSGISLKDSKQALLTSRLAGVLAQSGRKNFTEYYNSLIADTSGASVAALVDRITSFGTPCSPTCRRPSRTGICASGARPAPAARNPTRSP